jgi:hypothetical protein
VRPEELNRRLVDQFSDLCVPECCFRTRDQGEFHQIIRPGIKIFCAFSMPALARRQVAIQAIGRIYRSSVFNGGDQPIGQLASTAAGCSSRLPSESPPAAIG